MQKLFLIAACAGIALLGGCKAQSQYNLELDNAQVALEGRFPDLAARHLDKAGRIAAKRRMGRRDKPVLLRAEVLVQKGDYDGARSLAETIAHRNVHGTHRRGQAEELLGKIAIRQGRFADARRHLANADRSYKADADKQRAADLDKLVLGLQAYGRGRTQLAQNHWRSISNVRMRTSISAAGR